MAEQLKLNSERKDIVKPQGGFIPGLEGVEPEMLVIPRIKLVQKTSHEVDELEIKPGSLINSMTKDILAEFKKDGTVIKIIPILSGRSRIRFAPVGSDGQGILCRSYDGKIGQGDPGGNCLTCKYSKWWNNEAPECTDFINVFCIVRDYVLPIPIVATFGKTSYNAGKQLVNFFYMDAQRTQLPPWNFAYELGVKAITNDKGSFYVFTIKPAGKATAEEVKLGEQMYQLIKSVKIEIYEEEGDTEENGNEEANDEPASAAEDDIAPNF